MKPNPDFGPSFPRGFKTAGMAAGLKGSGKPDLGILYSETRAACAAVFTTNKVKAAPVWWDMDVRKRGYARAIVVNSGQANACTGKRGQEDVEKTVHELSGLLKISPEEILVASTGVIGKFVAMEKLLPGLKTIVPRLNENGGMDFARAIMTTDTVPKHAGLEIQCHGSTIRLGGCVKGSGMIAPNMATMLCFVTTDAAVDPADLQSALNTVVGDTLNQLTVDGDCSTNDSLLLLANGQSQCPPLKPGTREWEAFVGGLNTLLEYLSERLVSDGEGATKIMRVLVEGAATPADARKAARAVANSLLVKCALFGKDPNWGRILCAAGYSGADLNPEKVNLWLGGIPMLQNGEPLAFDHSLAVAALNQPKVEIKLDLGAGKASGSAWGCDLSYDYVKINAEYHT